MQSAVDAGNTFTLRIERSIAGLQQVGGWVDTVATRFGLNEAADYALRLCLEEAVANLVMHATTNGESDAEFVALRVEPEQSALRATIEDRCRPFDPLDMPAPQPPSTLAEAHIGGLGIHLMRQYARAMEYERADGVNRLTLTIER